MVSCASCVCKRVFEVISRQVVSVCVHCYRESSRIRQPPQVVTNTQGLKESVRGKWWRPEDLGIVDYSQQSLANSTNVMEQLLGSAGGAGRGGQGDDRLQSTAGGQRSLYNDQDVLVLTKDVVPLVPGLLDGLDRADGPSNSIARSRSASPVPRRGGRESTNNDGTYDSVSFRVICIPFAPAQLGWYHGECYSMKHSAGFTTSLCCWHRLPTESGINDVTGIDDFDEDVVSAMSLHSPDAPPAPPSSSSSRNIADNFVPSSTPLPTSYLAQAMGEGKGGATTEGNTRAGSTAEASSSVPKTARCKRCGLLISRSMEAIEAHMEECGVVNNPHGRNASVANTDKYVLAGPDGQAITITPGMSKSFGGITRRPELENFGTRIIYRTARKQGGKAVRPREVCALQDSFVDEDGACYVYEISVRHCDVMGLPNYVTADVMVSARWM